MASQGPPSTTSTRSATDILSGFPLLAVDGGSFIFPAPLAIPAPPSIAPVALPCPPPSLPFRSPAQVSLTPSSVKTACGLCTVEATGHIPCDNIECPFQAHACSECKDAYFSPTGNCPYCTTSRSA